MKLGIFTIETLLSTLLRRGIQRGHLPNVSLVDDDAGVPYALESDEKAVAVVQTDDGRDLLFTTFRVIDANGTLVCYSDVAECHWITDDPNVEAKARLKTTHYHRLVILLKRRGLPWKRRRRLVIDRLGQAVFPLLKFFESIATAR